MRPVSMADSRYVLALVASAAGIFRAMDRSKRFGKHYQPSWLENPWYHLSKLSWRVRFLSRGFLDQDTIEPPGRFVPPGGSFHSMPTGFIAAVFATA